MVVVDEPSNRLCKTGIDLYFVLERVHGGNTPEESVLDQVVRTAGRQWVRAQTKVSEALEQPETDPTKIPRLSQNCLAAFV